MKEDAFAIRHQISHCVAGLGHKTPFLPSSGGRVSLIPLSGTVAPSIYMIDFLGEKKTTVVTENLTKKAEYMSDSNKQLGDQIT